MKIGIIGGTGYVGGELIRLLLLHPQVDVTMVTSRQSAGDFVFNVHPNLRGLTQLKFVSLEVAELQKNCDIVFAATPHGGAVNLIPKLLETGLKVIDMSADFRLKNPSAYDKWYSWKHTNPQLLKEAVYGLPEFHRKEIKKANLVACPGCMATATILALAPAVKAGYVEENRIIADVKIGSSGGGSKPTMSSHHPERFGGVRPYKVVAHRHVAEVEQELNALSNEPVTVSFTPHAVNIVRGILSTVHTFMKAPLTSKDLWKTLRSTYQGEPFIRFVKYLKGPYQLPDPNRLLLFGAIDNMVKGASGQGVQCLNIMMSIDETTGLKSTGFHPM